MQTNRLWFGALTLLLLAGCDTTQIYNVPGNSVLVASAGKQFNQASVKKAIIRAGEQQGWQMEEADPGQLIATRSADERMAKVDIHYSAKSYSITYRDSSGFDYAGSKINEEYNNWVKRLEMAIKMQINNI